MLVMPSNSGKSHVHYWAGRYGMLGHLYSPGGQRGPFPRLPYALDNGAYPAFARGVPWNEKAYLKLLAWATAAPIAPRWVLVPDVVQDRNGTLRSWKRWAPALARFGWPLAFAAQDGMTFADVPSDAAVIFLGGSTEWKRAAIKPWCAKFPRVHVGRINTYPWLKYCTAMGAESCDGTGWFRGDINQTRGLERWLREASGAYLLDSPESLKSDVWEGRTVRVSRSSLTNALGRTSVVKLTTRASSPERTR